MIHPSAEVSHSAEIGPNTNIWAHTQVCDDARVGADCIVGRAVYIDRGVIVGNKVKIQTGAQLYHGATIEDGVFIGPLVCLANDMYPRSITIDGALKRDADWELGRTHVQYSASLGAGAIILPGMSIGKFAMVAAGSLVASDVPDYGLVMGVPAQLVGYVCRCGHSLHLVKEWVPSRWVCPSCRATYPELPQKALRVS